MRSSSLFQEDPALLESFVSETVSLTGWWYHLRNSVLKNSLSSSMGNELILVKPCTCYSVSLISCPHHPLLSLLLGGGREAAVQNDPHATSWKFSTLNLVIITSHGSEPWAQCGGKGPVSGKNEERGKMRSVKTNIVIQSSKWFTSLWGKVMIATGSAVLWVPFWNPKQGYLESQRAILSPKLPWRDLVGRANICNCFEKVSYWTRTSCIRFMWGSCARSWTSRSQNGPECGGVYSPLGPGSVFLGLGP